MNVLLTSVSRKVSLVQAFKSAVGPSGKVFTSDLSRYAVAQRFGDGVIRLPSSTSSTFIEDLVNACREWRIDLLVPTRDEELEPLAEARRYFAAIGTTVHVSPAEAVTTCLDKRRFHQFCDAHGHPVPPTILDPTVDDLPLFCRPRRGSGSVGSRLVSTHDELMSLEEDVVLTPVVSGEELTIDVFVASLGTTHSSVPRLRCRVINGESVVGRTVHDPELAEASLNLCLDLGLTGQNTVQAFRLSDSISFIEVNPRFGGGSPLSFAAGADSPRWLVQEASGARQLSPSPGTYRHDLVMLRYTQDLFVPADEITKDG